MKNNENGGYSGIRMTFKDSSSVIYFEPLTKEAFETFGDVIETAGREHVLINNGYTQKFAGLSRAETDEGGFVQMHIFRATPYAMPFELKMLEKHPLGSQTFLPATDAPFLLVVAPPGDIFTTDSIRAFYTNGKQGITYRKGVWHHPLMALGKTGDFYVIDRGGAGKSGNNLIEVFLDTPVQCCLNPSAGI